jgi:hypothetical protein
MAVTRKSAQIYNQQEIITGLTDFYHFLSSLPYIDPAAVLVPSPSGWPNISQENFSALGKNGDVIDLLKHLPYIDSSKRQYLIAPNTQPTDYRGEVFQQNVTVESIGRCKPLGDVEFPEWVINLTHGNRDGTYALLDTTDGKVRLGVELSYLRIRLNDVVGTVTEYNIQDSNDPKYGGNDPRSWRNYCEGKTRPFLALLDDWKDRYYTLQWMGHVSNGWPTIMWADRGDENYEEVKVRPIQMIAQRYV